MDTLTWEEALLKIFLSLLSVRVVSGRKFAPLEESMKILYNALRSKLKLKPSAFFFSGFILCWSYQHYCLVNHHSRIWSVMDWSWLRKLTVLLLLNFFWILVLNSKGYIFTNSVNPIQTGYSNQDPHCLKGTDLKLPSRSK